MTVFLDAVVVIYIIENHPTFGPVATQAVSRLNPTQFVANELVRMETLIVPRRANNKQLEADFEAYIANQCRMVPFDRSIFDSATDLRAKYRFLKTPDSLHLATAIASRCDAFVTNDARLTAITEIRVVAI